MKWQRDKSLVLQGIKPSNPQQVMKNGFSLDLLNMLMVSGKLHAFSSPQH
jgi:hypothetical protein